MSDGSVTSPTNEDGMVTEQGTEFQFNQTEIMESGSSKDALQSQDDYTVPNLNDISPSINQPFCSTTVQDIMETNLLHDIMDFCDDYQSLENTVQLQSSNNFFRVSPISQEDLYKRYTTQEYAILSMNDSYKTGDNPSSASLGNMDSSSGPSHAWDLIDQCEPLDIEAHRRAEDGCFVCPFCEKSIQQKFDFDLHCRTHTGGKLYSCHLCDKKFAMKSHLERHIRAHRDQLPYACDVCDKKFYTQWDLNTHHRIHTGEKSFDCDICDKKFKTQWGMSIHRRIHTGEKRYVCIFCDNKFYTQLDLNTHRQIHTGEKSYNCDICDKKFQTQSGVTIHRRIHSKKRYSCNMCEYKCSTKCKLEKHWETHSREKP